MRKSVLRRLLAFLLAASALRAAAFAETAKVTGSEVNVRSGPGTEYEIIGSYPRGSTVEVTSRANPSWYAIWFDGRTGYMSSQYLSIQADSGYQTIVSGESGGASIAIPRQDSTVYSPGAVNPPPAATAAPSPSPSPAVSGSALFISDWDQVGLVIAPPAQTEGPTLVITTPAPSPSHSPVPSPLPVVTPSPAPLPSPVPTAAPSASPEPVSAERSSGMIAGDYVRFRKGPGTSYSIIDTYDSGKPLTVLSHVGEWSFCLIDGQTGYVFSRYVQLETPAQSAAPLVSGGGELVLDNGSTPATPAPVPNAGETVAEPQPSSAVTEAAQPSVQPVSASGAEGYIRGNNVRFRSGPGLSYSIHTELYYGNSVTVTGTSGDWTAVVYKGQAGFVYSQYVVMGAAQTQSTGGTATGREIADYALSFLGTPYAWGGKSPAGFDCSGLVWYVYQHFGYTVNRVAADQAKNGRHIDAGELQPGDLLCFYSGGSYIGHSGIYIGNNMFVHAASSTTGVITSELTGYYAARGFEARRII